MKHSERIAAVSAVISAISSIACCLPLGIAAAIGAAGLSVVLQPLRPWLIGLSLAFLLVGFVQLYRAKNTCQRHSRTSIAIFWMAAIIVLAVTIFPQAVASFLADRLP